MRKSGSGITDAVAGGPRYRNISLSYRKPPEYMSTPVWCLGIPAPLMHHIYMVRNSHAKITCENQVSGIISAMAGGPRYRNMILSYEKPSKYLSTPVWHLGIPALLDYYMWCKIHTSNIACGNQVQV